MEYLPRTPATPGCTTRSPGRRTWCGCPVWWRSPISTRRRGAGIRTCTPTSSCPTGKPAPTARWCRSTATSLYHEAKAAGVIYQATLRRELHAVAGVRVGSRSTRTPGWPRLAGVDRDTITAWSRRSTQLRDWAAHNLVVVDGPLTAAQLAAAQKATRPAKPEELAWARTAGAVARRCARPAPGPRSASTRRARRARAAARAPFDRARLADAAAQHRQGRVHPRRPGRDHRRATARRRATGHRARLSRPRSTRSGCG